MFTYHLTQIGISGRYHPDISLTGTAVTQNFKRLVLQDSKQFHLAGRI